MLPVMANQDGLTPGARQAEIAASFQQLSSRFSAAHANADVQGHEQPNSNVPTALGSLSHPNFPAYISPESFFASQPPRLPDYSCGMCFMTFQSQPDLIRHVALMHPDVCTPPNASPYPTPSPTFATCAPSNPYAHIFAPAVPTPTAGGNVLLGTDSSTPAQSESRKPLGAFICDICDVRCDTKEQLDRHSVGQKHRKKAEMHAAFQQVALTFASNGISEQKPGLWVCSLCNSSIDNPNSVRQHLESVKHRRHAANVDMSRAQPSSPTTQLMESEIKRTQLQQQSIHDLSILKASFSQHSTAGNAQSVSTSITPNVPGLSAIRSPGQDNLSPSSVYKGAILAITKPSRSSPLAAANVVAAANGNNFHCSACGVTCNSKSSFAAHVSSSRHQRRMNASASPQSQGSKGSGTGSTFGSALAPGSSPTQSIGKSNTSKLSSGAAPQRSDVQFHCDICEVDVCGRINFETHILGKNHIKRARMRDAAAKPSANSIQQSPSRVPVTNAAISAPSSENAPQPTTFDSLTAMLRPDALSLNGNVGQAGKIAPSEDSNLAALSMYKYGNNAYVTPGFKQNKT